MNPIIVNEEEAITTFYNLFNRMFEEDARGGIYAYQRIGGTQVIEKLDHQDDERLTSYDETHKHFNNLIVIDGGNSDGDSWQYIFHIKSKVGIYINEIK